MVLEQYSNETNFDGRQLSDDLYSITENIEDSDNDNFDNDKIYNISEIENHIVIGSRNNDSSTDSQKIKLDEINFEYNNNEIVSTSFYNLEDLDKLKFNSIYNIISNSNMIIFVDNYKLLKSHNCIYNMVRRKINLIKEEFPGCTFFPFEYVSKLQKDIHILNNKILDAEMKNRKIYNNDDVCFNICFDEGEILKKVLYKKMEINDKILFVPINKYQLKQTEYRIRGFCQIVEELGAKQIEIKFKKNNIVTTKKNLDASIGSDIEVIAGSLGLSNSKSNNDKEDYSYTLNYPSNNTILLNEKALRKKIKKKKFIISEDIYNSNLELQYVIRSRCRHFISKYSTVFTFDNSFMIDNKIIAKLKSHNINLGLDYSKNTNKKYYLQIVTDVTFSDQDDYSNNLSGYSVSLNKTGYSFLIDSIRNKDNFNNEGIYKIMDFINLYIHKVLKHSPELDFRKLDLILEKIKKNLTINEYADLLCNYFTMNSQWIHFNNFIDLLANKTQSYDKLGYLIIMNQDNICLNDKLKILIKFIQEKCIEEKIEVNYWKMLQPHNSELKYFLHNKLLNEYDFIKNYNWYSLKSLINNIREYNINLDDLDELEKYIKIKQNMNLGYKQYEFINHMVPFIIRKSYRINYDKDIYKYSKLLEVSLNYESFMINKTDNISELEDYIKKKLDRIKLGYEMLEEIKKEFLARQTIEITSINKIKSFFISKKFVSKYDYIFKKLNFMIPNLDPELLEEFIISNDIDEKIQNQYILENLNDLCFNILLKIFGYNEKLNINNIPPNIFGFKLIMNRYYLGIKKIEFEKIVKPYITNLINNVIQIQYTFSSDEYKKLNNFDIFQIINFDYFNKNCDNYLNLIIHIKTILTNKLSLTLCNSLLNNLLIY